MKNAPVNPKLVEKLTTILEQAKRGELTSFAAVTFRAGNNRADHWAYLTRHEDMRNVVGELESLTQEQIEMGG